MSIKIFAMTHKLFTQSNDSLYVPLQVGSATHPHLGCLCDDTGDHISEKNYLYSELTGHYWLYKNYHDTDSIGVCHYRRYLLNEKEQLMTAFEYEDLLQKYDLITTKKIHLNFSYYYGFSQNHNQKDLDETGNVIKELYPDYYDTFKQLVHGKETYFGNIFACKKSLYDDYCQFLFTIFAELEKRIDVSSYDDYHKRVFGFISEFLLMVYAEVKHLHVYECKVGMIGEKAETKELKNDLSKFFLQKDVPGAKTYFLKYLEKRPDVMMEASDVMGDLRLAMQLIATCELQEELGEKSLLERTTDFASLLKYLGTLNSVMEHYHSNRNTPEDEIILQKLSPTPLVLEISTKIVGSFSPFSFSDIF